jgi:type II secretory pathway component PulF
MLPWAVVLAVLAVVVPRFAALFSELEVELPVATRALLTVSDALSIWWFVLLPFLCCTAVGLMVWAALSSKDITRWLGALTAVSLVVLGLTLGLVVFALFLPLIQLIHVMGQ